MLARTLVLLAGLAGAATASQAPTVMQQYQQRLGGAADELMRVVEDFDQDAASYGFSREMALERYAVSSEDFLVARGVSMRRALERFERIAAHRQALARATPLERPALFLQYRDPALFAGTMDDYRPAVPATTEGAVYAAAGFGLGAGLAGLGLIGWRRFRRPRGAAHA